MAFFCNFMVKIYLNNWFDIQYFQAWRRPTFMRVDETTFAFTIQRCFELCRFWKITIPRQMYWSWTTLSKLVDPESKIMVLGSPWHLHKPWKSLENHRKIIGNHRKNTIISMAISGNFMVNIYLNNWFDGLIWFSRSGLV